MSIQKVCNSLWNPPTGGPRATVVIRLMTGGVFLWEGILKFVYTNQGVGRFTKLGIPFPVPTAHFVAWVEIVGGILFILGWLTRPVAIAFILEMIVAILSTKISLLIDRRARSHLQGISKSFDRESFFLSPAARLECACSEGCLPDEFLGCLTA